VTRATTESSTDASGKTTSFAVSGVQHLQFDASVLDAAYADNPLAVEALFTEKNIGIGDHFDDELERLAGSNEGLVKTRVDAIRNRSDIFKDRIEYLNELILRKENRLYNEFYAMEQALSGLQSQASSLTALQNIPNINNNN
jgi:flagellar hook-associated protein 2